MAFTKLLRGSDVGKELNSLGREPVSPVQHSVAPSQARSVQDNSQTTCFPDASAPACPPIVVSLGYWCYTKMSLRKMGLDAETMPFDWIQTRLEGILYYLKHEFEGFMKYSAKERIPLSSGSGDKFMFRDALHSFWHDDPEDAEDIAKYRRRIARFNALDLTWQRLLFVRTVSCSNEVYRTEDLLHELVARFGERSHLLVIVDMQRQLQGPLLFAEQGSVMIYLHPPFVPIDKESWYLKPIQCALDWMGGQDIGATVLPSVERLASVPIDHWNFTDCVVRSFD